ncbi:hypothetical protein SGLAM104S_08212 [Streptomyces glaucescens]
MYETLTVDDPGRPGLDGATVLVLEKAEGSLAALLARAPRPPRGPALLAQICEGLHQLHGAGWVHGDLKPANVLLMGDGSARLADFNMAAELEGTHAYTPAFATPDYTPPELLWSEIGERGRRIRPSADIWAFGVLAHLVLTGAFPLPGATPAARRDAAVALRPRRGGAAPSPPDCRSAGGRSCGPAWPGHTRSGSAVRHCCGGCGRRRARPGRAARAAVRPVWPRRSPRWPRWWCSATATPPARGARVPPVRAERRAAPAPRRLPATEPTNSAPTRAFRPRTGGSSSTRRTPASGR